MEQMANPEDRMNQHIADLPYSLCQQLFMSLDVSEGWQLLADKAGLTYQDIVMISHMNNDSPSRQLLWRLGCEGYTVQMLHDALVDLGRMHEAAILHEHI